VPGGDLTVTELESCILALLEKNGSIDEWTPLTTILHCVNVWNISIWNTLIGSPDYTEVSIALANLIKRGVVRKKVPVNELDIPIYQRCNPLDLVAEV
jgi:hypothetical protein